MENIKSPGDKIVFLSAGNHSIQKGTVYLFEAWKQVQSGSAELWMVGTNLLPPTLVKGTFRNLRTLPRVPGQ